MSKYIDADELMHYMEERQERLKDDESLWELSVVETFLERVPSADVVEVVRCKNCTRRNIKCGMGEHRWCDFLNMSTGTNDYCSYGERKEQEHE